MEEQRRLIRLCSLDSFPPDRGAAVLARPPCVGGPGVLQSHLVGHDSGEAIGRHDPPEIQNCYCIPKFKFQKCHIIGFFRKLFSIIII